MRGVWKGWRRPVRRANSLAPVESVERVGAFLPVVIGGGTHGRGTESGVAVTTAHGHRVEGVDAATACALVVALEIASSVVSRRLS